MANQLKGKIPFEMVIDGTINGVVFQVVGSGCGNAAEGHLSGKFECTTQNLPLSFAALAPTFGYGFKCFAYYPEDICNFFHLCFPNGYTQERVTTYQSGGVITTSHVITMKDGKLYNKVKLTGIDFPADSPVLKNNLKIMLPSTEYTYPYENGVRSLGRHVFPLINGGGFEVADQVTINRPLGNDSVMRPDYHHTNTQIKQSNIQGNSVCQEEVSKAYTMKVF